MPLWTLDKPPVWPKKNGRKTPVLTEKGWEDPDTGEVLVCMNGRLVDAGSANIVDVYFDVSAYDQGDPIKVFVAFNENVDVLAGATVEVSWTGVSGNFFCTALAQTGVSAVEFSGVVPSEPGVMDITTGPAIVVGTITDAGTVTASDLTIPATISVAQITVA